MEAVPKMPMLSFSLKQTLQKSSFSRLKQVSKAYVIFPIPKIHRPSNIPVEMTEPKQATTIEFKFFFLGIFYPSVITFTNPIESSAQLRF